MKSILLYPILTEKATAASQKGIYAFAVDMQASKKQIKVVVESQFKVTVGQIKVSIRKGKIRRVGKKMQPKKQPDLKIAYVQLKKGSISLFPKA